MSRFAKFVDGLTSPITRDGRSPPTSPSERRREMYLRRRRRGESGDVVEKQDPVRRASLTAHISRATIQGSGAQPKPYDPVFLRDIAGMAVAQAYIDTLAQDVASAKWSIKPRDENADVSDDELAEFERRYRDLSPQKTAADRHEETTRILLELGDGVWAKHYESDRRENLVEVVNVDSASFFKKVDGHGFTDGYVQASFSRGKIENHFEDDEIVWFEWSGRPDRHYGQGPIEKASKEVELLEELIEKERLDLVQGSPPGVVYQEPDDDFGGMADEDWDTFVESMQLDEGERHRVGYSKYKVGFQPLSSNYQELQVLERSKYWVTVLGSVFKVNPSYAGFDFENVNRATDESQQEAYAQRGFRVTLRQLEEEINRALIWEDFSEDIKFEFEREQTAAEKKTHAELLQTQAEAGKQMVDAGRDVTYRDGVLDVEAGPMESGSVGSGGEGFFGSVDDPDEADLAVSTRRKGVDKGNGDGGGKPPMPFEKAVLLDDILFRAHKRQIFPKTLDEIEKRSWSRDEDVPDYVLEQIRDVINDGVVFDRFESIAGDVRDEVERVLEDKLTQPQGWSLTSIVDEFEEIFPGVDRDDLEVVARTESAKVLNESRERGYEDQPGSEDFLFKWQGPDDSRTTDACDELKELTNPDYGGEPRPMGELVRLQRQVQSEHFPRLSFRKHTVHPNERHTFVRAFDVDVEVPGAEQFNVEVAGA